MKTYLLRTLLVLTFAAELWARAQTLAGDSLYLYPTATLPLTCNTGSVRFDSVAGTLKVCVLNAWIAAGGSFSSPMTTAGDLIYQNSTTAARLAVGTANSVLTAPNGTPAWAAIINANVDPAAGITYSKLNLTGQLQNADVASTAAIAYTKLNLTASIVGSDISTAAALTVATLQTNSFANFIGAVTAASTLNVTGATNFAGVITAASTLSVTGNASFAGSIRAANGSATAPSIAFTNDTATGIYRIGALDWGVAVGGVTAIDILENSGFLTWGFGTTASGNVDFPLRWAMTDNTDVTYEMFNNSTGNSSSVQFVFQDGVTSGQYLSFQSYRSNYTPKTYLANSGWIRTGFNQTALVLGTEYTSGRVEFVFSQTPSSTTEYAFMTTAAFGIEKGMTLGLGGGTSGTVSMVVQPAAGTYNWNLPVASGSLGNLLVSGGGGTVAMTWTAAACGTLSNAAASCSVDATNASNIGSGTLATAQLPATIAIGTNATTNGVLSLATNTAAGTSVSILNGGSTTAYNFVLPAGPGTLGQLLNSGGGTSPMTWSSALSNPMAAGGDMIIGGAAGAATKLASGTTGTYLKSNGTNAETWAAFGSYTATILTGGTNGVFTPAASDIAMFVRCWGGGGGSGGVATTSGTQISCVGGGGGGGYVEKLFTTMSGNANYTISSGATAAGAGAGSVGGAAASTSFIFNGVNMTAGGGGGSVGGTASSSGPAFYTGGGAGGVAVGGDLNVGGNSGGACFSFTSTGQVGSGGGPSYGTNVPQFVGVGNTTGATGIFPGGGAVGGANIAGQSSTRGGSPGAAGVCIVYEFHNGG